MAQSKGKEIAKVEPQETALTIPDYLKDEVGKGKGMIDSKNIKLGFIKLLQSLSPEVKSKLFEDGHMINSVTQEDYGTELVFTPLMEIKQAMKWLPREEGGGIECQSKNLTQGTKYGECAACPHCFARFLSDKTARTTQCILYHQYPSIINNEALPVVIGFEMNKSKNKAGQQLANSILANKQQLPPYCFSFKLKVFADRSKSGSFDFHNFKVEGNGFVSGDKYTETKSWSERLKDIKVDVEMEGADDTRAPF